MPLNHPKWGIHDVGAYQISGIPFLSASTLNPGENKSATAWIKNTGNDAQKLILWTEGWEPVSAQNSILLTWNYNNEWIEAGSAIPVTFTLTVDPSISGVESFCFDIWIKGVA